MSRRVLVLTSSTGSGHDMRARAFAEWVRERHGPEVEVRIEKIIENGSLLGRFGVWVYNTIHRHAPWLHHLYFHIVEVFVAGNARGVAFGGQYYRHLLRDWRPDVVFSVHDSTNRGYFEDARKCLGSGVRCVTYCGEFSGGYGFSRNWVNPSADCFIARTEATRREAVRLGMPPDRTRTFQKFLPPGAFLPSLDPDDGKALKKQLGLDPDRFTVFLATGGYGANHHRDFLEAILPLADQVQAILVCGRNQRVFEHMKRWTRAHRNLRTYLEGYSSRMPEFLQISDAVVTRGGANTTMEALHFGCPILYNALGGLMPQETCTVRHIVDNRAAVLIRRPRDLQQHLRSWARFGEDYRQLQSRLRQLVHEEDPASLVQSVLG